MFDAAAGGDVTPDDIQADVLLLSAALGLIACEAPTAAGPVRYATAQPESIYSFRQLDLARCQAACPPAAAPEQVMDCYPASVEVKRRIMSELVKDTHLVCVYQRGASR